MSQFEKHVKQSTEVLGTYINEPVDRAGTTEVSPLRPSVINWIVEATDPAQLALPLDKLPPAPGQHKPIIHNYYPDFPESPVFSIHTYETTEKDNWELYYKAVSAYADTHPFESLTTEQAWNIPADLLFEYRARVYNRLDALCKLSKNPASQTIYLKDCRILKDLVKTELQKLLVPEHPASEVVKAQRAETIRHLENLYVLFDGYNLRTIRIKATPQKP